MAPKPIRRIMAQGTLEKDGQCIDWSATYEPSTGKCYARIAGKDHFLPMVGADPHTQVQWSSLVAQIIGQKGVKCDEPIVLLRWGDSSTEIDEAHRITCLVHKYLYGGDDKTRIARAPRVSSIPISVPHSTEMVKEMKAALSSRPNVQVLYFSCHGTEKTFAYDAEGSSEINFKCFGESLGDALNRCCITHLVLGSCEAMTTECIVRDMPPQVYAVSGFSGCPCAHDVATLLFGTLSEHVDLFEKLTSAANETCGLSRRAAWQSLVEQHDDSPTRRIWANPDLRVVRYKRLADNLAEWRRDEWTLPED